MVQNNASHLALRKGAQELKIDESLKRVDGGLEGPIDFSILYLPLSLNISIPCDMKHHAPKKKVKTRITFCSEMLF